MPFDNFIQELDSFQVVTPQPAAYQAAATSVMAIIAQRFPSLQRLMQLCLADAVDSESRIQEATRLLSTNAPHAMQQAIAVLQGLPASHISNASA